MKIEKAWSVSSKSEKIVKGEELVKIAGQWNTGIEVSITKPYTYSQGPVEKVIITKETHSKENLLSPSTT